MDLIVELDQFKLMMTQRSLKRTKKINHEIVSHLSQVSQSKFLKIMMRMTLKSKKVFQRMSLEKN